MKDAKFLIQKRNHMIHVNSTDINIQEVASGVHSYLSSIAEQENLNLSELVLEFFTYVEGMQYSSRKNIHLA